MGDISKMARKAFTTASEHGWHDAPVEFGTGIALIHSELSEALQEYRRGATLTGTYFDANGAPQGIPTELADAVIRIMDLCEEFGIDLETAITQKMDYNETRTYRHGGKRI